MSLGFLIWYLPRIILWHLVACPDNKYGEFCNHDCKCEEPCSDIQGRCPGKCVPGKRSSKTYNIYGDCTEGKHINSVYQQI